MAEETVLKVSLREYKKEIDDLRAEMLQLAESSKEYKEKSEQVAEMQGKLNKVMAVGKRTVQGASDSYNALNFELNEAKKRYKELSKAERENADVGGKLLAKIRDLDSTLKDTDAEMGVFTRNVGNYKGAIEDTFRLGFQGLSSMGGKIGEIGATVNMLFPLIKKGLSATTTGIKGIGAAIKAIPFMLIISALVTIISSWDDIRDAIFGVDEEYQKVLNDADMFLQAQEAIFDDLQREVKIMKAKGASQKEILEYQKKIVEGQLAEAQAQKKNLKIEIERLKNHSWLYRLIMGENGKIEEAEEKLKGINDNIKTLTKQVKDIDTDITVENLTGSGKSGKQVESYISQTLKRLKDFGKTELQILDETFAAEQEKLKAEYAKNLKKREEYEKALTLLIQEHNEKREKLLKTIANADSDIEDRLNKRQYGDAWDEAALQRQYNLEYKLLHNAKVAELELAGDNAEKRKEIEIKYANFFKILNEELAENYKKLEDTKVEKTVSTEEKVLAARKDAALKAENYNFDMSDDKSEDAKVKHIENLWAIQDDYYNSIIEMNNKLLENEYLTDEEKDKIRERIHQAEMARKDAEMKKDVDVKNTIVKQEKKSWKDIVNVAAQGAQALAGIMDSVASLWQEDIKRKQEDGEISEEEARAQFERTKKVQYGAAVLNTAAGIVTAIATAQKLGPPMGPIVGAINAAAVAAAGAIQIAQISRQTYDSAGSGGGANNPIIIPPMAQYSETNVVNPTERDSIDSLNETLKNQTVVVKITDVEKVENRKKATIAESNW